MNKRFITCLVNIIVPLGGMSTDIYLPSLPAMVQHFGAGNQLIQLTVALFTLGLGVGQLIAGPISDALGRKKVLLVALLVQILSVFCILFSSSIHWVIAARLLQGVGTAFMMVPARAVLNDMFSGIELKKQFATLATSFALGPIIAPFLGGYLQHYGGWKTNFWFILCYQVVALTLVSFFYKETIHGKKKFSVVHVKHSYAVVLSSRRFLAGGVLVSFFMAYIATFDVTGPFIIQTVLGQSALVYGRVALAMGLAWFAGNLCSRFFAHKDTKNVTIILLSLTILVALIMRLAFTTTTLYSLVVPVFLIIFFSAILFPLYIAKGLSMFKEQAATANGLLFSILWVGFSLFAFLASAFKASSMLPLANLFIVVGVLVLLWYWLIYRRVRS